MCIQFNYNSYCKATNILYEIKKNLRIVSVQKFICSKF